MELVNDNLDLNVDIMQFSGKTIVISGATGLIGQTLIKRCIEYNKILAVPINIIALIRNKEKADRVFGKNNRNITYKIGDISDIDLNDIQADYIVHTASQTSSVGFVEKPIETIMISIDGTKKMLEYAKTQKNLKKFIFLSTMEVYGAPQTDLKIAENYSSDLDTMDVRSCYPESKRLCENLCVAYMKEFGVPINVLRLTQTFGEGVKYNDRRVFAEFARCVIEKRNIVLKTKGQTERNYLYTEDAVNAILLTMYKANIGEAYNVANEDTYCSIVGLAELVANKIAGGEIKVIIQEQDTAKLGYASTLHMNLDTSKIRKLGWLPEHDLEYMFKKMIQDMQCRKYETER